tara:strand:+ start:1583 stop:2419 length:837 start_codon:yes stop_codon:yes gene_type:complete
MKKLIFFSTIKGDVDFFPITKMSAHRFNWQATAKEECVEVLKENPTHTHYHRCPSFPLLNSMGAVIKLPFDIDFKKLDDGNVEWNVRGNPTISTADTFKELKIIEWHNKHNISESHSILGDGVLKINTSWMVACTDPTIKILFLPIMTPDQDIFTAVGGALDLSKTAGFINIQGYLRGSFKDYTLRAGTPLAQILPLTNEKLKIEFRHALEHDQNLNHSLFYMTERGFSPKERQRIAQQAHNTWGEVERSRINVFRRKTNNLFRNTKNWFKKRGDAFS